MAAAALTPGTRVGPYLVGERLGAGAMGEVYAGRDTRLQRRVALKRLFADDDSRHRVLREARAAARINDPNVAAVYDVFEEAGGAFIVMEFVEGENLAACLPGTRLPVDRVVAITRQVAAGLAAAHAQGVIHRDLKPANIQLTPAGVAKILDFGVAKATRSILPTGAAGDLSTQADDAPGAHRVGTPAYMSPEQFAGAPLDERSDLYSLGIVLCEMIAGRRFSHDEYARIANQPEYLGKMPAALASVIGTALQPDPKRRFQSAAAFAAALAAVENKPSLGWHYLALAAGIVALIALAAVSWSQRGESASGAPVRFVRSVAVLPLVNLSKDPSQEYFSDGMTDELINTLGRLGALKVTARTSVMALKTTKKSIAQIAADLGVDALLEGSALLAPNPQGMETVRVAINLVDPQTQAVIWSDTIERSLTNVLSIQAEIAQRIAAKFNLQITADEQSRLQSGRTVDPQAYKLYLLGREALARRQADHVRRAVTLFEQSILQAPDYAPAHAGLADAYALLTGDIGGLPRQEGARKTVDSATRALQLDPMLAEAHTSLGFANFFLIWDWKSAEVHFERALQLNPSLATAHHWYGNFLSDMGRESDALEQMRIAFELDRGSAIIQRDIAWPLFFSERYQEAKVHLQDTLATHPAFLPAERLLARTQIQMGEFDEALRRYLAILARQENVRDRYELAWAYTVAGRRPDAERQLTLAIAASATSRYPYDRALTYTALGRNEDALAELELAYQEHDSTLVNLKHDTRLKALRNEPRYRNLVARMRFPS